MSSCCAKLRQLSCTLCHARHDFTLGAREDFLLHKYHKSTASRDSGGGDGHHRTDDLCNAEVGDGSAFSRVLLAEGLDQLWRHGVHRANLRHVTRHVRPSSTLKLLVRARNMILPCTCPAHCKHAHMYRLKRARRRPHLCQNQSLAEHNNHVVRRSVSRRDAIDVEEMSKHLHLGMSVSPTTISNDALVALLG